MYVNLYFGVKIRQFYYPAYETREEGEMETMFGSKFAERERILKFVCMLFSEFLTRTSASRMSSSGGSDPY